LTLKDRLTRGLIAGIAAGIIQDVLDYTAYLLNLSQLRYLDWVGIIVFGAKPVTRGETFLALGGEIFFSGILGVIFAYLIQKINSSNIFLKGWLYGVVIWFGTYSVMTLFKVEGFVKIDFYTALSDVITSSIYGLVLPGFPPTHNEVGGVTFKPL